MFLSTLTLRGFKSFADKTVIELEPGITVIVGPNGSGKSNIVDALTWVLGTSSAKALRGGAMADVIFAGSGGQGRRSGRSALGRAAVDITIDNARGVLPIEFSEVTVGRSMFASGENAYGINGVDCRLLDVQELLSDTGLGREHHTIVGQGQLDAVLDARPEDRRAFIEEAAGILKHRRRKERALRKLAQMEAHVERLGDVLRELRRGLRPMERQAEAAAKHAELQAALAEVRRVRALRELAALTAREEDQRSGHAASSARLAALDAALAEGRAAEGAVEAELGRLTPAARAATETHFRLANLVERLRGVADRIEERRAGLAAAAEEPVAGRDPAELRARAAAERDDLATLAAERTAARAAAGEAEQHRRDAERTRRAHEQAAAAEARRRAEARERLLRWEGEVAALRSGLAQAAGEQGRLAGQVAGLEARAAELRDDVVAGRAALERHDAAASPLRADRETARAALARAAAALDEAAAGERALERRRASLEARAEALRAAGRDAVGDAAALAAAAEAGELEGVLGPLADHVHVDEGAARALAAALGPLGEALVVTDRAAARAGVAYVRERDAGRVLLLPAPAPSAADAAPAVADDDRAGRLADAGARPLAAAVHAEGGLGATLRFCLAAVHVVDDFDTACALAARHPDLAFVTVDGELAGTRGYAGGAATAGSAVVTRAAADQAEAELAGVAEALVAATRGVVEAGLDRDAARRDGDAAAAAVHESDALVAAAGERLGRLKSELAAAERQLAAVRGQSAELDADLAARAERLAALEARGMAAAPEGADEGPDLEAERLDDALVEAREAEVQARLATGEVEQRGAELDRRIVALEREADDVERRLAERERRRLARLAAIARCGELAGVAAVALDRAERSLTASARERDELEEARGARQRALGELRARLRAFDAEHQGLVADRHAGDLARAELRHALDAVRARFAGAVRLGPDPDLDPDAALADAVAAGDDGPLAGGEDADRALAEREEGLSRRVGLLGAVNPLAREEFAALRERADFLTGQLEDLRSSRRDLLAVVEAVDGRIREVFGAAFADVAAAFTEVFPRLFPGGDGRLVLTDPDDLLTTGVEVEARPPGKRVKRLSLLSGGERSLTALAVLFAIFTARPSPFYVLDEVEAALDDVNLQRFLDVLVDFKRTSQLLVVTHQRRTMEVADMLYGVSMRGDGVSRVVGQRLTEDDDHAAAARTAT